MHAVSRAGEVVKGACGARGEGHLRAILQIIAYLIRKQGTVSGLNMLLLGGRGDTSSKWDWKIKLTLLIPEGRAEVQGDTGFYYLDSSLIHVKVRED